MFPKQTPCRIELNKITKTHENYFTPAKSKTGPAFVFIGVHPWFPSTSLFRHVASRSFLRPLVVPFFRHPNSFFRAIFHGGSGGMHFTTSQAMSLRRLLIGVHSCPFVVSLALPRPPRKYLKTHFSHSHL